MQTPKLLIYSDQVSFPVLEFFKDCFFIKRNEDELCGHWNQRAVRTKHYLGDVLIDKQATTYNVLSATIVGSVGPLWGYTLFYGRRVKVRLKLEAQENGISFDEVKKKINRSFRRWHGWKSNDSYPAVRKAVQTAKSISELIDQLEVLMPRRS